MENGGLLEEKVICIARRRSQQDDHRHNVVFKQTSRGRFERFVASPHLGKGQDTLTAQFLDNCILRLVGFQNSQRNKGTGLDILRP